MSWTFFFALSVCGTVTALYEIVEWITAVSAGGGATAFLGTQGDPWDTQEDMATCFVGALAALVLLGRVHDGQCAGSMGRREPQWTWSQH